MKPVFDPDYDRLKHSLTNHTPDQDTIEVIESLRARALEFGEGILMSQPPSRERSLAITKLEESVMWAVKGMVL